MVWYILNLDYQILLDTHNIQGSITKHGIRFPHHNYIFVCIQVFCNISQAIMGCTHNSTNHFQALICHVFSLHCQIVLLGTRNVQGSITTQGTMYAYHLYIPICIHKCFPTLPRLSYDILALVLIILRLWLTMFWVYTAKYCYYVPVMY